MYILDTLATFQVLNNHFLWAAAILSNEDMTLNLHFFYPPTVNWKVLI